MIITVFGGSAPKPDSSAYQDAIILGQLLAEAGHTVATGGYTGVMEGVSRGANEQGGHVIGITCADLEAYRPTKANRWVIEERRYQTLRERLLALIDICDAAIALPGGIGTLVEISLTWNELLVGSLRPKPLIVVGDGWKKCLTGLKQFQDDYIPDKDMKWVQFAENIDEAVNKLTQSKTIH